MLNNPTKKNNIAIERRPGTMLDIDIAIVAAIIVPKVLIIKHLVFLQGQILFL